MLPAVQAFAGCYRPVFCCSAVGLLHYHILLDPTYIHERCPAAEALIRQRLLLLPELDNHLAQKVSPSNARLQPLAIQMVVHLVNTCVLEVGCAMAVDLFNTLEMLCKLASHISNGAQLIALVDKARRVNNRYH